jgi:hypothetical protein
MKIIYGLRAGGIFLALCVIILFSLSCVAGNGGDPSSTTQITTVQKGPIAITLTGAGKITEVHPVEGNNPPEKAAPGHSVEPHNFIATVLVAAEYVHSIKLNGGAFVSLDTLKGYYYPAKITQIASVTTISRGVVNYPVTVEFEAANISALPNHTPNMLSSAVHLKDGLLSVISIPVIQRESVLIVSSRAISRQGPGSSVQLIGETATQTVTVRTGLSDGSNTEIVSGLKEGDQVLVRNNTVLMGISAMPVSHYTPEYSIGK